MTTTKRFWISSLAVALAVGGCKAEVTDRGNAPDVNVEGGDLPNVDLDPSKVDVDVSVDTQKIQVPNVDVNTKGEGNP